MTMPQRDAIPGFAVAIDDRFETVWTSDAATALLAGRDLFAALDPTSGAKLRAAVERVTTHGTPTTSEVNLLTVTGEHRTHLLELGPRPQGGVVIAGVDITRYVDAAQANLEQWSAAERDAEVAETRLHDQDTVLEVVLGQLPGALWALDRGGRVLELAGSRLDAFGWDEVPTGAGIEQLLGTDRTTQAWHAHLTAMDGAATSFEYHAGERVFQVRVEPRTGTYGERDGCVGFALDVTELRRAADRTREALVRERAALVQLQDLDHRKRELVTAVSHEMRTPLTKLHSGALLLLRVLTGDDPTQTQARAVAESMQRGSDRLRQLLDDLADVGELHAERRSGGVAIQLDEVVGRAVEDWAARTGRTAATELEPVSYAIAPEHAERLLGVLLDNVAEHTPPGTTAWVTLREHDGRVSLVVADDGPGIAAGDHTTVVAPFSHGSNLREHAPGLGLGLTVADRLARAYGGSLDVEERPGGGTLCRVTLPPSGPPDATPVADATVTALSLAGAGTDLESITRPLLEALQTLTGLSSTYLTSIDWARGTQSIEHALNTGELEVPEGAEIDWSDTVCRRALESGQSWTDDVPAVWGDSAAGRELGLQTYVSAAVVLPDGEVYGTLCGASGDRIPVDERTARLLRVFSRVIADVVTRERARQASEARALAAEERMASRARFLAMAEHTIKAPLSVVVGWSHALQAGRLDPEGAQEAADALARAADRLALRVEEMLEEARAEVFASDLRPERLDLGPWLAALGADLDPMSAAHTLRVVEVPADLTATADPRALRVAVEHLVENAVKYAPAGEITISASVTPAGRTAVAVRDRGPGLPTDVDVFAPFVRGQHPDTDGTGLGLHVVRSLLHAMGGDVVAEQRDPGTEFRLLLPR